MEYGIFMFKAKTIIKEIQKFNPKISKSCLEALRSSEKDLIFEDCKKKLFKNVLVSQ